MQSWKEQKDYVRELIDHISEGLGSDPEEWLMEYKADVLMANKEDLEGLIKCLERLKKELPIMVKEQRNNVPLL